MHIKSRNRYAGSTAHIGKFTAELLGSEWRLSIDTDSGSHFEFTHLHSLNAVRYTIASFGL